MKFSDLKYLFKPDFWIQVGKQNKVWDKKLNDLMDKRLCINRSDQYSVIIGDCEIWVSNYPYSYGTFIPKDNILPDANTLPNN